MYAVAHLLTDSIESRKKGTLGDPLIFVSIDIKCVAVYYIVYNYAV